MRIEKGRIIREALMAGCGARRGRLRATLLNSNDVPSWLGLRRLWLLELLGRAKAINDSWLCLSRGLNTQK
jgi:hypothetical protein